MTRECGSTSVGACVCRLRVSDRVSFWLWFHLICYEKVCVTLCEALYMFSRPV